jgi:hypothetical protein
VGAIVELHPAATDTLTLRVDGRAITCGPHSIERYWERIRSTLPSLDAAAEDLQRVAEAAGEIVFETPVWFESGIAHYERERPAVAWLMLGDDVALPLAACNFNPGAYFAPTCVMRGGTNEHEQRETRLARQRTAARRSHVRHLRTSHRFGRPVTTAEQAPRLRTSDYLADAA